MGLVQWDSSFSVEIKRFDDQHKTLFDIINRLHDAMTAGQGRTVLGKTFDDLLNYTRTHFAAEEAVLQAQGFPELATQRREHEGFCKTLAKYKAQFDSGSTALSIDIMQLLQDWLKHHITVEDRKYSAFLKAKGIF
jgi:hemerythrin